MAIKPSYSLMWLLVCLAFLYFFILQVYAIWPFTIDDMYISLRYAKHWYEGYGLVWNIGEPPLEGYSNFSFVCLARLALLLGLEPVTCLKSLGVAGLFGSCLAVYFITRFWVNARLAWIPVLWLLAYQGEILWSVSGLETTLYQALLCFAVVFIFRGLGSVDNSSSEARRPATCSRDPEILFNAQHYCTEIDLAGSREQVAGRRHLNCQQALGYQPDRQKKTTVNLRAFAIAGVLMAVASLTRPEVPMCMLVFVVILIMQKNKPFDRHYWHGVFVFCATYLVIFAPYFVWRWHLFGRLLPNPVYCKALTGAMQFSLDKHYLSLLWPFALLALLAVFMRKSTTSLGRVQVDNRHYFLWLPSVLYGVLLIDADPIVAFDNRLFLPAFALMLPLAFQGLRCGLNLLFEITANPFCDSERKRWCVVVAALVFMFLFIPMKSLSGYRYFTHNPIAGEQMRQQIVRWLYQHTNAQQQVVLADSGLIPFYTQRHFIDSYCLNNAEMTRTHNAKMYQQFCEQMKVTKPAVIILTALIENGRVVYTPADACLVQWLETNKCYQWQKNFNSGDRQSNYRYSVYKLMGEGRVYSLERHMI